MAKPNKADGFLAVYYGALITAGLVVLVLGLIEVNQYNDPRLMAMGLLATIVPAALFPIAIGLRAAGRQAQFDRAVDALGLLSDRILTSDAAKSIAYRHQERDMLEAAIREDIDQGDFDGALTLVTRMSEIYGYREQAEAFREEIEAARAAEFNRKQSEALEQLDRYLDRYEWDKAMAHVRKVQRLFPDSPKVKGLKRAVFEARERRKHQLERDFLQAAERDEVNAAMDLLQELDKYLTEAEAEPFRETARGGHRQAARQPGCAVQAGGQGQGVGPRGSRG